jgi:hypothetical protein
MLADARGGAMNPNDLDRLKYLLALFPSDLSMRKNWGFHQLTSGGRVWVSDGERGVWGESGIEAAQGNHNLVIDFVACLPTIREIVAEYEEWAEVDEDE